MRSVVCNCNASRVCNQAEEMHLAVMTYTLTLDYIPLSRITYQAFGLDKNKTVRRLSYFLAKGYKKDFFDSFAYDFEPSQKIAAQPCISSISKKLHIIKTKSCISSLRKLLYKPYGVMRYNTAFPCCLYTH